MRRTIPSIILVAVTTGLLAALSAQAPVPAPAAPTEVTFARDIQPIFDRSCASCHSATLKLAEFDLSTRDAAMKGGEHGVAIVPGSAERSKLYQMIAGLAEPAMPMQGDPLNKEDIAKIKAWIDRGANWDAPAAAAAAAPAVAAAPSQSAEVFTKEIRPIMQRTCWNCHGATGQASRLDLRSKEGAMRGGARGPAIIPGNAEGSRLYRIVAGHEAIRMPFELPPLTSAEVASVKKWIDSGGEWDADASVGTATAASMSVLAALENREITQAERNYWAFKLPVQAALPDVSNPDLTHPIDRFLEKARTDKGLVTAPRADRRALIRRAYLDLIGMPPTPAQVNAFVGDKSHDAWLKVIDELLASPHYGERYGRHWLDVARYADSNGFEQDYDRPNAFRYRDYVIKSLNQDKPYRQFLREQIAGDEMDGKNFETLIATGFLRAGPRVLFREKDNPERRWDYVEDLLATLGRGVLGLTVNCARCHNHKFDPIAQKDYYALAAAINGWIEIDVPLAPRAEAEAYTKANKEIDAKVDALRDKIAAIEKPYRDTLRAEYIKREFPPNVQAAVFKPEAERTPGEQLLATQVLGGGGGGNPEELAKLMSADEMAQTKELSSQVAALEQQRPAPLPMAEIITDGDWRFYPNGRGDETIGCPKCRLPPPDKPNGTLLHEGPGKYEPPPTHFLIRGDPDSRGSLMKPGFIQVAMHGDHPTEIPRPDGKTSGRRLALAEWVTSEQNPLTPRVIVNRIWNHHFGRGIVATVDNFGKMGEQPTHPELLDWLAVEFMKRGWSLKQLHRLIMTSEAYQMASVFDHGGNLTKDPTNNFLWRYRPQRLDAETIRDAILSTSGSIDLKMGGPAIFPHVPQQILDTEKTKGTWNNQPDGPAVWRRSVYIYQRRSLPYPMFETFDHPDMNISAGSRNVSTVPTQALTLLNNPFVLRQAELLAQRIVSEAPDDVAKQIDLGYQYALSRPATEIERSIAMKTVKEQSLVDFTHVLFNLSEFLYMR
jgi:mono/diheme cytochrome c family protein